MIATNEGLMKLLGEENRQFNVPIYQRKYRWDYEDCRRLIEDIVIAGKEGREHFTGTIVYQQGYFNSCFLVDGQQRLTTIVLIIKAMEMLSIARKKSEDTEKDDYAYVSKKCQKYLFRDAEDPREGWKIVPGEEDKEALDLILSSYSMEDLEKNPKFSSLKKEMMISNFLCIEEYIKKLLDKGEGIRSTFFEGLLRLTIIRMELSPRDDAQEIFESINSLGKKLTNADLIRNYLLMSDHHEIQEEHYRKYWKPIEQELIGENNMDGFVSDYLMSILSSPVAYGDVYKTFVSYATGNHQRSPDRVELLADLYRVAGIYRVFLREDSSFSKETNRLMQELRDMHQGTPYPFLIRVFSDYQENRINENTLNQVINMIVVYLVRRTVSGVSSRSLRGLMLSLYSRVFKIKANYQKYYESIYAFLSTLDTNDRMPTLKSFEEGLKTYPLYINTRFATYLLYRIENGRYPEEHQEYTRAENVSVEHIMPQNLSDSWKEMLGPSWEDIQSKYLNTLGNLSLSSQSKNSSMGNDSFTRKKSIMALDSSKFTTLNKGLDQLDKFGVEEIENREKSLSTILYKEYSLPEVNIEGIHFEAVVEVPLSDTPNRIFLNSVPVAFRLFGVEYPIPDFGSLLQQFGKVIYSLYPNKILALVDEGWKAFDTDTGSRIYRGKQELSQDIEIEPGLYFRANSWANYRVVFCAKILEAFWKPLDSMSILLRKDSIRKHLSDDQERELLKEALTRLNEEGFLEYDPKTMPEHPDWIKFLVPEMDQLFLYEGEPIVWDNVLTKHVGYLQFCVKNDSMYLTLRCLPNTRSMEDKILAKIGEEHAPKNKDEAFWNFKSYHVNFDRVANAKDGKAEMINLVKELVNEAKTYLAGLNK